MNIDTIFIPCAGKGTRMGEVGKIVPKPLWPFFETTLLEFQIEYFKRLGIEKFIINTHHLHEQFEKYKNRVEILFEPDLLGSGGGLHNIKKHHPDLKKILISNPDIMLDLSMQEWNQFLIESNKDNIENVLIGLPCTQGDSYNELVVSGDSFEGIQKAPQRNYLTYSGIGIVDLASFNYVEGESSFFDTVVNRKLNKTMVIGFEPRNNYWDFGTLGLYTENILKIIEAKESSLREMLISMEIMDNTKKYRNKNVIKFGQIEFDLNKDMTIVKAKVDGIGYSL